MNHSTPSRWVHPAPLSWQHSPHILSIIRFLSICTVTIQTDVKLMYLDIRTNNIYIMLSCQTLTGQGFTQFRQSHTQRIQLIFRKLYTNILSKTHSDTLVTSYIHFPHYCSGYPYKKPDVSTLTKINPLLFHSAQFLMFKEHNETTWKLSTGSAHPVRYHYQTKAV